MSSRGRCVFLFFAPGGENNRAKRPTHIKTNMISKTPPGIYEYYRGWPNHVGHVKGMLRRGFRITIFDECSRGDNLKPRLERVVVGG